ncbi:hypothetical protein J437_LFUL009209 [Ladona fulva]|uniref:Uncharacterized protein n=1 Tax=Ladona fulva TaxID=123851 RepID=A0A8K0NZF3_LADFU|nr:hypothetical protein J437_LFUL009209 [Ladona fulva]
MAPSPVVVAGGMVAMSSTPVGSQAHEMEESGEGMMETEEEDRSTPPRMASTVAVRSNDDTISMDATSMDEPQSEHTMDEHSAIENSNMDESQSATSATVGEVQPQCGGPHSSHPSPSPPANPCTSPPPPSSSSPPRPHSMMDSTSPPPEHIVPSQQSTGNPDICDPESQSNTISGMKRTPHGNGPMMHLQQQPVLSPSEDSLSRGAPNSPSASGTPRPDTSPKRNLPPSPPPSSSYDLSHQRHPQSLPPRYDEPPPEHMRAFPPPVLQPPPPLPQAPPLCHMPLSPGVSSLQPGAPPLYTPAPPPPPTAMPPMSPSLGRAYPSPSSPPHYGTQQPHQPPPQIPPCPTMHSAPPPMQSAPPPMRLMPQHSPSYFIHDSMREGPPAPKDPVDTLEGIPEMSMKCPPESHSIEADSGSEMNINQESHIVVSGRGKEGLDESSIQMEDSSAQSGSPPRSHLSVDNAPSNADGGETMGSEGSSEAPDLQMGMKSHPVPEGNQQQQQLLDNTQ